VSDIRLQSVRTVRLDIYDCSVDDTIIQWSIVNVFRLGYTILTRSIWILRRRQRVNTIIEDYHRGAYSQPGVSYSGLYDESVRAGYKYLIRSLSKEIARVSNNQLIKRDRSSELQSVYTEFSKNPASSSSIIENYHRGAYSQPGGAQQWIIELRKIEKKSSCNDTGDLKESLYC